MYQNRSGTPTTSPLHGWPLDVQGHHFALGQTIDWSADVIRAFANERLADHPGAGMWECDLDGDRLTWSDQVYDIFGIPRGAHVSRAEALTYYSEHSRVAMERLRDNAIVNKQSFVLDAEIRPGHRSEPIWMRLVAAPVCKDGKVVGLQGFKQII